MNKNANFRPNLVLLGQNILILLEKSKVLLATKRKNHLGTLFALVFGHPWDQMGQKCQYLTKNTNIGPNLVVFGPKILIFMRVSKSFGNHIMDNLFALSFGRHGSKCAKNADIWPKWPVFGQIRLFLGQKSNFWRGGSKTFGTLISGNQ